MLITIGNVFLSFVSCLIIFFVIEQIIEKFSKENFETKKLRYDKSIHSAFTVLLILFFLFCGGVRHTLVSTFAVAYIASAVYNTYKLKKLEKEEKENNEQQKQ